jgi:EAL domain-containing protein (putative c-di-GMP-specific phosphodiesterase class I)
LSRLAQLPIDILKIDRSFVRAAGQGNANERRLVESIVSMTESLDLEPVAEGIEFPEDLACMLEAGCRYGQGYLLARPMPAADFSALMTRDLVATTHGGVAR